MPRVTAPYIEFGAWSPDSQWIAYWISSQEDVEKSTNFMPGGTLNFMNVTSGEICAVSQFVTPDNRTAEVIWSEESQVIVVMAKEAFAGRPCQAELYRRLNNYVPEHPLTDPALSPDQQYHADTALISSENGILTFATTLATVGSTQSLQRVTWQIDERLGEYGLGGEWISKEQFLLHETLDQGPLIIDTEHGIIPVLTKLLGLDEIPSIAGSEEYGLRAIPLPAMETDSFHLLVHGVGLEANFPNVMLYHAENKAIETLPFRHVWREGFSPDGQWLLMDERPDIGGYEAHTISIRRVEERNGHWRTIAVDVNSVLWNRDWTEMAFNSDETLIWQTFPEAERIGEWKTKPFWTYPAAWSPDGRFLLTIGNIPGAVEYGLFILER